MKKQNKIELKRKLEEVTDKLNKKIINIQKDILVLEKYYDSLVEYINTLDSKTLSKDELYELKSYIEVQREEVNWMINNLRRIEDRF